MAIAELSRVLLLCPRSELGNLLASLCDFGLFHPSDREGLVQDLGLLLLSSRAHFVYTEATALSREKKSESLTDGVTFEARDPESLVAELEKRLQEIRSNLLRPDINQMMRLELYRRLEGLRDASLLAFRNLSRVRALAATKRFVVIEGFVPSDSLALFRERVKDYFFWSEPVKKRTRGEPYVPSLFVNPRIISLFESITLVSGVPAYNEIDPTPVIAFVFPLFFGIMFSDLGHGLVLTLLGLVLASRPQIGYSYWGRLLTVFGVSAMIFGFVRGAAFGFELPYRELLPLPSVLKGSLTIQSVLVWLVIAIVIGTFHLATAYLFAILNRIRSGDYAEALLSHLPTLVLYSAIIPFALALYGAGFRWNVLFGSDSPTPILRDLGGAGVGIALVADVSFPLVAGSFLTLIAGRATYAAISQRGLRIALQEMSRGLLDGLMRPLEFLLNTVSYTRLGIFLVVGSVLGSLVSSLYKLGLQGIVLAVFGNLAVMAMEGFIVYVQDLRLHVYEWFTKFYTGHGKPFVPMVSKGEFSAVKWL